jgi:hypothetical protein
MRAMLLALAIALPVLGPREAAAADRFVAIAYSQSIGTYGYYHKAASRAQAEEGALQECGRDCQVVIWARNACASLAVGQGKGYGTYWSSDEDAVVDGAVAECAKRTSHCESKVMTCSDY